MTKGFLFAIMLLGAAGYGLFRLDPAGAAVGGKWFEVTPGNFESEVTGSRVPVVAYFWAPWCGACTRMTPSVEQLAGELGGRARVAKINVDDFPAEAAKYGIRAIPAILLLDGGKVVETVLPADEIAMCRQIEGRL